jgi:predicted nuclease of predicted toxin-antitoxin system
MNFLVDENMPRSLAPQIVSLGFLVQDVRDIGLRARPDDEVMEAAIAADVIIITRDRGFANPKTWPTEFTAGMILVDLPSNTPTKTVNDRILELIAKRLPASLLGAITTIEPYRALSQIVRRRPKRT